MKLSAHAGIENEPSHWPRKRARTLALKLSMCTRKEVDLDLGTETEPSSNQDMVLDFHPTIVAAIHTACQSCQQPALAVGMLIDAGLWLLSAGNCFGL